MKILGIETSCDETAAAIVTDKREILSNVIFSQIDEHQPFGGVVPEIASRSHVNNIDIVIKSALSEAGLKSASEIDAIAVTAGPGLIGGVVVGLTAAKAMAAALGKPFIAVNHLEGHALTARLTNPELKFPFLLLLASGGHCQILITHNVGKYEILGATKDDALGECFDKAAKILGLDYPGGPEIEKRAKLGNKNKHQLPIALKGQDNCDFSFSGLKTAVHHLVRKEKDSEGNLSPTQINDVCASLQECFAQILEDRLKHAIAKYEQLSKGNINRKLVFAGGVAANEYLRNSLTNFLSKYNYELITPPIKLCTDNAAMIAWAGIEKLQNGQNDSLDFAPRSRWPL
jgi:N6-L-threonylcarbamoyladenine synthase